MAHVTAPQAHRSPQHHHAARPFPACVADPPAGPQAVVGLLARGGPDAVQAALMALANQRGALGLRLRAGRFGVLLLLAGREDGSAARATALAPGLGFPLRLRRLDLPVSAIHVGWQRREAAAAAAAWLAEQGAPDGLILLTDSAAPVAPGWLLAQAAAAADGRAVFDGPALALPLAAWRASDGLPPVAAPAALAVRLLMAGVAVSGPPVPRPASWLRRWRERRLEAALLALWGSGAGLLRPGGAVLARLARRAAVPEPVLLQLLRAPRFETAWAALRAASPRLAA